MTKSDLPGRTCWSGSPLIVIGAAQSSIRDFRKPLRRMCEGGKARMEAQRKTVPLATQRAAAQLRLLPHGDGEERRAGRPRNGQQHRDGDEALFRDCRFAGGARVLEHPTATAQRPTTTTKQTTDDETTHGFAVIQSRTALLLGLSSPGRVEP